MWQRGYVYLGGQLLALQYDGAGSWVHQEPFSKGQRITNSTGTITSTVEVDPFGGETSRSVNSAFQPKKYTTYTRDSDLSDEAMHRRYSFTLARFQQPDPYDGSYSLIDPQSFNRYSYVGNDPVNFVDPSGLTYQVCTAEFGGPACMGQGFWGGGVAGGNGWGYDPRPGLREIRQDEMELHPISRVINDRRDDLYGFSSLFAGYSLFFGFFSQEPRPSPHPSPKLNPQQSGFDSCARAAYRRYRSRYLRTTGKTALGTVTWVGGMAVGGLAFKGAVHAAKDLTLSPVGRLLTVGLELGDSGAIVAITSLVSGKVALDGIKEGFQNSAQTGREIEDCKNQFPNAKHSFSSLNF